MSDSGRDGREYAGMSSAMLMRNQHTENLRFPAEGLSAQGKSAPKVRLKSVADGKRVKNPVPGNIRLRDGVKQK